MNKDLKDKKLIVFGGLAQQIEIIKRARRRGAHVVCIDYLADSPGKQYANESHNISIKDTKKIIALARRIKADGIMNYCIDPGQKPYVEVCEALGLPCYGTQDQFRFLTNKDLFYKLCVDNGVGVVERIEFDESLTKNSDLSYPIVVKPADGRASRGFTIVKEAGQLTDAINHALNNSDRKELIIQEYVDADQLCAKYYVNNGKIYLSSVSDTHAYFKNSERVCINGKVYPSKYTREYLQKADHKIKNLIKSLGIYNGPLSFTAFYHNGGFKFFDPSFRLGGGEEWRLISHITGVDLSDILTTYAIKGYVEDESLDGLDKGFMNHFSVNPFLLGDVGLIGQIQINCELEKLQTYVGHHFAKKEGERINNYGTVDHVVARFFFSSKNKDNVIEDVNRLLTSIKVYDPDNNDITLPFMDVESYR